ADAANEYVEQRAPWTLKKDPLKARELQDVCTVVLNLFRQIAVYLAPVLPELATKAGALLLQPIRSWDEAQRPLQGTKTAPFAHMMVRVEASKVAAMFSASKEPAAPATPTPPAATGSGTTGGEPQLEPLAPMITIDDFQKIDLRIARVVGAAEVPEAKKLLWLTLSLGGTETRNVFAGIKGAYTPEQLLGRLVVMVANLQPRQMKFGVSEGMVVAAGSEGRVFLLSPDAGARPGDRLH
ncbi:MAG TPA: methionine--tRNA ligase subunit beta, partial [Planctomycetota bacterium]|nr:methionine--tRNA ligase subunit beta [Planctomycetota bacterium]